MNTQREAQGRPYRIRFDRLDVDAVHAMLVRAYWCEGIPRGVGCRCCRT